ncbi:hypothetical protein [Saccharibacillus kuerlensis]|uniref:YgiT-type zinc finger domain-containing protein n=1 Tax=Saccharibacillus kuerlensis TaxID=459527 RepID=A0ABQ2KTR7_9BACL|nr:hypothetical protein [Saccharibacillus kuerlensis]GGN92443.1 hypothetical protein GCM10010969_04990 [Saccharibacillus kuerlensis]
MSFCCGASMIGTKGTLKHYRTQVHNVPLLYCPVCQRIEVHYKVESEYEILAEYAHGDGEAEINFQDYVLEDEAEMFANCVSLESEDKLESVRNQIDMSLDLLGVAKGMGDKRWQVDLKRRLAVMSQKLEKLQHSKR